MVKLFMLNNKVSPIVGEWIRKAQDDELSIKAILKEKGAPSTVCFLSQQMAEKFLKAYLINKQREFPKIHHLERLLGLCKEIDRSFKVLNNEAVLLSEYYIETRYPGDYPEGLSWREAEEAYAAALKITDFVMDKI